MQISSHKQSSHYSMRNLYSNRIQITQLLAMMKYKWSKIKIIRMGSWNTTKTNLFKDSLYSCLKRLPSSLSVLWIWSLLEHVLRNSWWWRMLKTEAQQHLEFHRIPTLKIITHFLHTALIPSHKTVHEFQRYKLLFSCGYTIWKVVFFAHII